MNENSENKRCLEGVLTRAQAPTSPACPEELKLLAKMNDANGRSREEAISTLEEFIRRTS